MRSLALVVMLAALAPPVYGFGFGDVARQAEQLAGKAYREPDDELPRAVRELDYDQYRSIRFRPERALWRGSKLPFEVQFFHPGLFYRQPVKIHMIDRGGVRPMIFNPMNFDYQKLKLTLTADEMARLGYAGFRLHFPINRKDYKDEIAVFLGASYFRGLGKGQRYGLSARGLAIDTGELSGEEFPAFREFWIERPAADAQELEVYALLDSRRVTGAYRFVIRPGAETHMDVQARLFLRDDVGKLGFAPLTSMFYSGENQQGAVEDYRPEVHDSDGLLIADGNGEWIWRPLVNPRRLLVTSFGLLNPRGFGLMQRDRSFTSYQDLEARYDLRPSAWVTPKGRWGGGRVELVQIPSPDETNDNIVAYWVPLKSPQPGKPFDLQYRVSWQHQKIATPPLARVAQSRRDHGYNRMPDDTLRFVLDFEGGELAKLPPGAKPDGIVWIGEGGELLEKQVYRHDVTGGWRMVFKLRRQPDRAVELRAALRQDARPLSETWSYILPP